MNKNLNSVTLKKLNYLAYKVRLDCVDMIECAHSGHIGASFSAVEILIMLYEFFIDRMNPDRARFCLSKGHAAPALYSVLKHYQFLPQNISWKKEFRCINGLLQGHPSIEIPGIDVSSGSLGMCLSVCVGLALAARLNGSVRNIYALIGDGELNEGQIWESVMAASKFTLDRITAIVDRNGSQGSGYCTEVMPLTNIYQAFNAFGWEVLECNGHDFCELLDALTKPHSKPLVIIASTIKNKGLSNYENKLELYGEKLSKQQFSDFRKKLLRGFKNGEPQSCSC